MQFAADFAQRWIVNWLEKRSANYKTKPVLNPQTTIPSTPNSPGVQEIVIEDTDAAANTPDSVSTDKEATKSRKNSNGQQEPAIQSEPKTPSIKRRQAQNEGLELFDCYI